jgi:hypothetical protein
MDSWPVEEITDMVHGSIGACWNIIIRKSDGTIHSHIMPKSIFAIRAVEYDMDVDADFDAILEMILHEPFMQDPNALPAEEDVAGAAGYNTKIADGTKRPATLFTAETIKDAREAHRMRVEDTKKNRRHIDHSSLSTSDKQRLRQGHLDAPSKVLRGLKDQIGLQRREIRGRPDGKPLKG